MSSGAGLLIDANLFGLGWRPIFLINIVLGMAALAAGSAFTYRYLTRQPTTPAEQAQHPEPAQTGG